MGTSNFRRYSGNKFIGCKLIDDALGDLFDWNALEKSIGDIMHQAFSKIDDLVNIDENGVYCNNIDWEDFENLMSFDYGYYDGFSVGLHLELLDGLDGVYWCIDNQKYKIKSILEKALEDVYKYIKEECEIDVYWLHLDGVFSNGETIYSEVK